MDKKTILFVGGGYEAVPGVRQAAALGYNAIVLDRDADAPCVEFASDFIEGDVYDSQNALRALENYKGKLSIDGVVTIGCDAPGTVARLSAFLGLKSMSMETARLATNKLLMKDSLAAGGVPVPEYLSIGSLAQLKESIEAGRVYVLKPVDNRGARGVLRIDGDVDLDWAYRHSSSYSISDKSLLLESWVSGEQISAESVVYNGRAGLVAAAHRGYERTTRFYPYIIEDGGETPADLSAKVLKDIDDVLGKAAAAIGLESGTLKGDLVVTPEGRVVVIEVAARLSGGNFCTVNIPRVYGVDLIEASIRIATGEGLDLDKYLRPSTCYVANRYLFLEPGRVDSIRFNKDISGIAGVIYWKLNVAVGDVIKGVTDHTKRHGTVISYAPTKEAAIAIAEDALNSIEVVLGTDGNGIERE